MEFNLTYTCPSCHVSFSKSDFERYCKMSKGDYHFCRCLLCSWKINYYRLLKTNNDTPQVISLIIYNIVEKMLKEEIKDILKNRPLGYHKKINTLFDSVYKSIYDSIDMNRLINKIKELENMKNDEDIYPDISTLTGSDIEIADIENEIYNLILFDYKDYIISSKVYDFIEENGSDEFLD